MRFSPIMVPSSSARPGKEASERWKMQHWTTAIYHSRANPAERRSQEIKKGLRLRLHDEDHTKWDLHLPNILYQLRSRRNAATGYTPAQLLLGPNLERPGNWQIDWIGHNLGNSVLLKLLLTNPNIKRNTLKSNLRHRMF